MSTYEQEFTQADITRIIETYNNIEDDQQAQIIALINETYHPLRSLYAKEVQTKAYDSVHYHIDTLAIRFDFTEILNTAHMIAYINYIRAYTTTSNQKLATYAILKVAHECHNKIQLWQSIKQEVGKTLDLTQEQMNEATTYADAINTQRKGLGLSQEQIIKATTYADTVNTQFLHAMRQLKNTEKQEQMSHTL